MLFCFHVASRAKHICALASGYRTSSLKILLAVAQDAHAELQHQLTTMATAHEQAQAEAEQLRADGAAKVALLENFELRFRQQQRCGASNDKTDVISSSQHLHYVRVSSFDCVFFLSIDAHLGTATSTAVWTAEWALTCQRTWGYHKEAVNATSTTCDDAHP